MKFGKLRALTSYVTKKEKSFLIRIASISCVLNPRHHWATVRCLLVYSAQNSRHTDADAKIDDSVDGVEVVGYELT